MRAALDHLLEVEGGGTNVSSRGGGARVSRASHKPRGRMDSHTWSQQEGGMVERGKRYMEAGNLTRAPGCNRGLVTMRMRIIPVGVKTDRKILSYFWCTFVSALSLAGGAGVVPSRLG